MLAFLPKRANRFKRDDKGNVAIIFGLTATVAVMFVGMGIDTGRVVHSKSNVRTATDAAALMAAKALRIEGKTEAEAIQIGKNAFDENMKGASGRWVNIDSVNIYVDNASSEIKVDVEAHVKMNFASVLGITEMKTPASSAALFEKKDVEVSLQLDLTGSMCNGGAPAPCTNSPKIQGLKDATKDLVDILIPDTPAPQKVRIAFAPFTAGVNLGSYQASVADGRTSTDNCVYERVSDTNQASDVAPVANDSYMIRSDLQAAPHVVPNPRSCPSAPVVPLTDNKSALKTTVDGYVADGYTAGHNGTAWAWNLLSPNFSSVWPLASEPASYSDTKTFKNVILMTDGEYNTKNGKGWSAIQVSQIAVDTCNAMKAAGIRVYTVGFALGGNATAVNTMSACASNPSDFFQAATPDELRTAFKSIANNIMKLRLTN